MKKMNYEFRAWFKEYNLMVYFELGQDYFKETYREGDLSNSVTLELKDADDVMQWSGVFDCLGQKIYDKDYINVDWDDPRYPPYNEKVEWDNDSASFQLPGGRPHSDSHHFIVTGNFYQGHIEYSPNKDYGKY